jgi:hypothetical protein
LCITVSIALPAFPPNLFGRILSFTSSKLIHQPFVLIVRWILDATLGLFTPVAATHTIRTVASHVTCVTADATDDVGSVVALLRAIIFAVTDLAAVLTGLVFVIA